MNNHRVLCHQCSSRNHRISVDCKQKVLNSCSCIQYRYGTYVFKQGQNYTYYRYLTQTSETYQIQKILFTPFQFFIQFSNSIYFNPFQSISIPFQSILIYFNPFQSISIPFQSISVHFKQFQAISSNFMPINPIRIGTETV